MNCELCQAREKEQHRILKQTEQFFILIPNAPLKEGHCMLLPARHVTSFGNLTEQEASALFQELEHLKQAFLKYYAEHPLIVINSGSHSTQPHLHIHLLPSKGSLRTLISSYENIPQRKEAPKETLQEMKEKIKRLF